MDKVEIKSVEFKSVHRNIDFQPDIDLGGYHIYPFVFLDEAKDWASGALFDIDPDSHTAVAKVTEPEVQLIEHAIKGNGWFLDIDPKGKITKHYLDAEKPIVLQYGTGHAFCFVAGNEGLLIQNVTTPPFNPSMEKIIEEYSPELPKAFWQEYNQLILPSPLPASLPRK
ncbi:MAG: hypothetical protein UX85_C0004G0111 [Candidatus Beckwithbacteria bacterium GW2011_GWB1_47_15]|uniref:Uncharacterized protein n=1 Tax=Candidatus Beckwithbacteria bacterium GW2011_GWB1_47_15 TaxID=1618371 RepID=A0A0G1RV75_9BACT|nr:MAG: hypothetical protein UY43_C0001G0130 [Candidatus Beckwithbacteria bacterium GW2011_GWC1_49_16]KKU35514.1 MAG: hypothetical protein UX50_C0003G0111 [Candidatus Beckwithbacteria bacterium GW2011_GWA1_46_30]KKU61189.1 MAG: hypothetical protein UX85_C0004G0111 [Candidatus Beckwithbacteria bacterium GW2011_GWB1_47_15]KKU72028.1 MAG: hypothetical protein UX97_C0002G0111 [Candidatus Beckwithbacteria bacterium GW2011_GWA2_47_25]KKW03266.1 MAG: hypothetical protein UY37_C0006G0091 [Candidatus Be